MNEMYISASIKSNYVLFRTRVRAARRRGGAPLLLGRNLRDVLNNT